MSGPKLMCAGCGRVEVGIFSPACPACLREFQQAKPPERPMPSPMTTADATDVLREAIREGRYERDRASPRDAAEWQAEAEAALTHLATMADPDALTIAYMAGAERARAEMQAEIEGLRLLESQLRDAASLALAQNEKLRADAERYRWLRLRLAAEEIDNLNAAHMALDIVGPIGLRPADVDYCGELDAAIDAARRGE